MSTISTTAVASNWGQTEAKKTDLYRLGNCVKAVATSVVCALPSSSPTAVCSAGLLALGITWFREHSCYTKSVIRNAAIAGLIVSSFSLKTEISHLKNPEPLAGKQSLQRTK